MHDYDRRLATAHPRSYVEAVDQAVKKFGIKKGLERKVNEAKQVARRLDQAVKDENALNPDDDWAHDSTKSAKLWKELQQIFEHCFGYDPPALGTI